MHSINFSHPLWIEQKLSFCKEKNVTNTLCLVCRLFLSSSPLFFFFFSVFVFLFVSSTTHPFSDFSQTTLKMFLGQFSWLHSEIGFFWLFVSVAAVSSQHVFWIDLKFNFIVPEKKKNENLDQIRKDLSRQRSPCLELVTSGRIHSLARVAGCVVRLLSAGSTRRIRGKNYNRNPCCYRYFQRLQCLHFHPAPLK